MLAVIHLCECYQEMDTVFASIEEGSKLCFIGWGHDICLDGGESEDDSLIEIGVVISSAIKVGCGVSVDIWLKKMRYISVYGKDHVTV